MTPQEVENTRLSLLGRINAAIAGRNNDDYLEQANAFKARVEAAATMPPTFKCRLICSSVLLAELDQLELDLQLPPAQPE